MTDAQRDELFAIGILRICEALHSSRTGSDGGTFLLPVRREICREYLLERVSGWKRSSSRYDAIVFALVLETLATREGM